MNHVTPLKTNSKCTWKLMVTRHYFPFGSWPVFRCYVCFRECNFTGCTATTTTATADGWNPVSPEIYQTNPLGEKHRMSPILNPQLVQGFLPSTTSWWLNQPVWKILYSQIGSFHHVVRLKLKSLWDHHVDSYRLLGKEKCSFWRSFDWVCFFDAWKRFQKSSPKWWWKMVIYHGTILEKNHLKNKSNKK